jgi:hypothetical protein
MTNKEKITLKKSWQITDSHRITMVGGTYRKALSYLNSLKNANVKDLLIKPLLIGD